MHRSLFAVAALLVVAAPAHAQLPQAKQILAVVKSHKDSDHLNAVMCGVWKDGKPIVETAMGISMTGVPATRDMHYRVGGVTYTCLATLLLMFDDLDKLSLSDPVSKWYPNLPNAKRVTLAMLANCTSGYPDYVPDAEFLKDMVKDPFREFSSAQLLHYAFRTPLLYEPGKGFNYSHTNFVILGEIIEKVGKRPLGELLHKYMFKPLGLKETYVPSNSEIRQPVLHGFTKDRDVYEDSTYWNPSWTRAAGMLVSTIHDLGVLCNAIGNGRFLSRKNFKLQTEPARLGLGMNKKEAYYGYGVIMLNGWIAQNPNLQGYATMFAYLPAKKLSIVVTATQSLNSGPKRGDMPIFYELAKLLAPGYPVTDISK